MVLGMGNPAGATNFGDRLLITSRIALIRQTVFLAALTCLAIAFCSAQSANDSLRKLPMGYELYSWQEANGSWDFCLLPSPSGVSIRAEEVFNKKFLLHGVNGVNRGLSKLPIGATIIWLDRILPEARSKVAESHCLGYPSADIIEQVRRYAATRHLQVQMLRKNQEQ